MTVQNVGDYETGLEDFDMEDAVIPRLTIVHKEGEYKDSLSGEQFGKLNIIILGLVKQRVLWHHTLDEGDWPMCRSHNHDEGIPNESDDQPKDKRFPWDKSGFEKKDFTENENGNILLPCSGCALKEWKSHPDGKKPYCAEQFALPILMDPKGDGELWVPSIFTVQKTGLRPLKTYLTSFSRSKSAAFTVVTEIGLDMLKKGTTDYSVPNFKTVGATDEENWREYSVAFRGMKEFLIQEPGSRVEDVEIEPSSNVNKGPEPKAEDPVEKPAEKEDIVEAEIVPDPEPEVKAPEPEPEAKKEEPVVPPEDDDDLPF